MQNYKLAAFALYPVHYHTPLFKKIAQHSMIDIKVYFCSDRYLRETLDAGLYLLIKSDTPMLEGYIYKFLPSLSIKSLSISFGFINPAIIRELRSNRYDAIWIHGYASLSNWLAFLGAWISKTPILLRGESNLLGDRTSWKRMFRKILLRIIFKRVKGFLAIGKLNKEYYLRYGVPKEKIFHVPYVADDDFFYKQKERWAARYNETKGELGIAQDDAVILYAGKILKKKGPQDLLRAFEKIEKSHLAKLIFVGDGKERPLLEEYAKKQRINNVIFAGFKNQSELSKYYSIADILALPSYAEPWGMVINEAMYFNIAIIASDCVGAAYDLVRHGRNGYIFPAGGIDTLANLLKELIENKELLQAMKLESGRIIQAWNLKVCTSGVLTALEYIRNNK